MNQPPRASTAGTTQASTWNLPSARALAAMARRAADPARREPAGAADEGDAEHVLEAGGPGWFDSSFDLGRGLLVLEGLPANASVAEWLQQTVYR